MYVAKANCSECDQPKPAALLDINGLCPRCRFSTTVSKPNQLSPPYEDVTFSKGMIVGVRSAAGEVMSGEITDIDERDDGQTVLTVALI